MPAPLFWLGASAIAALASAKYSHDKRLRSVVSVYPGEGDIHVIPVNGSIVTCGVYGLFDHCGIWVDGNVVELKGNGLIRGISPSRFLHDRSGDCIYLACDNNHTPLIDPNAVERAVSKLFTYSEYDLFKNNCHKFVWQCITGINEPLHQFSQLNQRLSKHFATAICWQPVKLDH